MVGATDHRGDGEVDVVHHRGQAVEIAAVGADQHGIALARLVDMLGPRTRSVQALRPPESLKRQWGRLALASRRARSPAEGERGAVVDRRRAALELELALEGEFLRRLVAGIEPPARLQPLGRLGIALQAIRLARHLVPGKAQPAEIRLDALGEGGGRALAIRIVEAQQEPAAGALGIKPVGERDIGIAGMEPARRARREADASAHASAAEAVGDRIAAVAAEGAAGDLDAGRRLAALVFGQIEHAPDPAHRGLVIALGDDLLHRHLAFHQAFQDRIQLVIGRQGILVGLVGLQLRRRRLGDDALGITTPAGPAPPMGRSSLRQRESAKTVVL